MKLTDEDQLFLIPTAMYMDQLRPRLGQGFIKGKYSYTELAVDIVTRKNMSATARKFGCSTTNIDLHVRKIRRYSKLERIRSRAARYMISIIS